MYEQRKWEDCDWHFINDLEVASWDWWDLDMVYENVVQCLRFLYRKSDIQLGQRRMLRNLN